MPSSLRTRPAAKAAAQADGSKENNPNFLGERLAAFRKLNGLSLEQVATRADITKSYLSKLERGLSSPTIATMLKLARALEVGPEQLLEEASLDDEIVLVKAKDRIPFSRSNERQGYTYEAIAAGRPNKAMMPFVMSPPSIVKDKKDLASHAGEELIFLISGKMEVIFADRTIEMNVGDSLYFNASIPHRSRSISKTPAKALVVVSDPAKRLAADAGLS